MRIGLHYKKRNGKIINLGIILNYHQTCIEKRNGHLYKRKRQTYNFGFFFSKTDV